MTDLIFAVDGSEIREKAVEVGSLYHYLLKFYTSNRWLFGISSTNSITNPKQFHYFFQGEPLQQLPYGCFQK